MSYQTFYHPYRKVLRIPCVFSVVFGVIFSMLLLSSCNSNSANKSTASKPTKIKPAKPAKPICDPKLISLQGSKSVPSFEAYIYTTAQGHAGANAQKNTRTTYAASLSTIDRSN